MSDYLRHFPCIPEAEICTFYEVKQPYGEGLLVVFGEGDMGWYEWLAVDSAGKLLRRTDENYGSPEIALRDALIWASST